MIQSLDDLLPQEVRQQLEDLLSQPVEWGKVEFIIERGRVFTVAVTRSVLTSANCKMEGTCIVDKLPV
jgi:hypothetical protein